MARTRNAALGHLQDPDSPGAHSAGRTIGIESAARSAPERQTLLVMDPAIVINPSLQEKVPYDLVKDLQTVSVIGSSPLVLVVHPGVPAASMAQLVEYAKAHPGKL